MLLPHKVYKNVSEISPSVLLKNGIKGIIVDIDNTLTTHDNPHPYPYVKQWLLDLESHGIKIIAVSNNTAERVHPFAEILGLDYIADGKKPLSTGLRRAANRLGLPKSKLAIVGDQIFTDILGGRLYGIVSLFVEPIQPESTAFFKFKRTLEKPLLALYHTLNER